jgi:hypothetical protein
VSSVKVTKPEGETATIGLGIGYHYFDHKGELLALDDSSLFFKYEERLYKFPLSDISKVYVHGYSLESVKVPAMIGLLLIDIMVVTGETDDENILNPIYGGSAILTPIIFLSGDAKVNFKPPFKDDDLQKIKLYCRYPQGLTQEQWGTLLKAHNQEVFLRFKN